MVDHKCIICGDIDCREHSLQEQIAYADAEAAKQPLTKRELNDLTEALTAGCFSCGKGIGEAFYDRSNGIVGVISFDHGSPATFLEPEDPGGVYFICTECYEAGEKLKERAELAKLVPDLIRETYWTLEELQENKGIVKTQIEEIEKQLRAKKAILHFYEHELRKGEEK